jgi:hypothetical protein
VLFSIGEPLKLLAIRGKNKDPDEKNSTEKEI